MKEQGWRAVAAAQAGLITRAQLAEAGMTRWSIAHRVASERWQLLSPTVVATVTGELTDEQRIWNAVLHAGPGAMAGGLTAASLAGLRNWDRDQITVLVPYERGRPSALDGVGFVRSRRRLRSVGSPPRCRVEPAVLLFAASDRSERSAQGVLAAAVQQQLTSPQRLLEWLDRLAPLRRAATLRRAVEDIEGGAQSLAEMDVRRMCRDLGLARPTRQVKRRDADGRVRYTDCEWRLPSGRILVLEVDGGFHMEIEHWEDDLARQRALTAPDRIIVRCTARELRDEPERVGRDLRALGVPLAA